MMFSGVVVTITTIQAESAPASLRIIASFFTVALLVMGWRDCRHAAARQRGIYVEFDAQAAVTRLAAAFHLIAHAGYRVHGIGDVDLLLHQITGTTTHRCIAVEIKSYAAFSRRDDRMLRAAAQVRSQVERVHAVGGIIWLPCVTPTFLQRFFRVYIDGIPVVFGSAKKLLRATSLMLEG